MCVHLMMCRGGSAAAWMGVPDPACLPACLPACAAEMFVGRLPVMFMDEISTGLDSASTFLITKALRNICVFMNVRPVPPTGPMCWQPTFICGQQQAQTAHMHTWPASTFGGPCIHALRWTCMGSSSCATNMIFSLVSLVTTLPHPTSPDPRNMCPDLTPS